MMQLVQEEIIELDESIEKYLPEIARRSGYSESTRITLRQLANHTLDLIREPKLLNAATSPINTDKLPPPMRPSKPKK